MEWKKTHLSIYFTTTRLEASVRIKRSISIFCMPQHLPYNTYCIVTFNILLSSMWLRHGGAARHARDSYTRTCIYWELGLPLLCAVHHNTYIMSHNLFYLPQYIAIYQCRPIYLISFCSRRLSAAARAAATAPPPKPIITTLCVFVYIYFNIYTVCVGASCRGGVNDTLAVYMFLLFA